jgi:hypothetical protein
MLVWRTITEHMLLRNNNSTDDFLTITKKRRLSRE